MAKPTKTRAPLAPLSDDELAARVRSALHGVGLKSAALGQRVGKAHAARALELARGLAAAGELHRVGAGQAEQFFGADPKGTLDRVVPDLLREQGPLSEADIKAQAKIRAPGHDGLVKDWLNGALARCVLFQHAPRAGAKTKTFGVTPDPALAPLSDDELRARVTSAVSERGVNQKQLADELGKKHAARALTLAGELAARGDLWRTASGKDVWFFGADPIATLDRVVLELLREKSPRTEADIKAEAKARAPGHDGILKDWLRGALGRQILFQLPSPAGSKGIKRFGLEPDLKALLGKPLAELQKAIGTVERSGVSRETILDFLRRELGAVASPPKRASRDVFLEALKRFAADNPSGALLPVRELRVRAGLGKQDFDAAALALSKEGLLELHHHDHAGALSEAEQSALVRDGLGQHYVGIALRGSA